MASLPWPMPLVSTRTRSKPTAWQASIARSMQFAISRPLARLANERMNRFSSARLFIRILSPSRAPPVLLRVGSVASRATFAPGLSRWILSISSSVRLDFPAPPVPVNPTTGQPSPSLIVRTRLSAARNLSSSAFSARVSNFASSPCWFAEIGPERDLKRAEPRRSIPLASSMASPTIPVKPISRPSSGE